MDILNVDVLPPPGHDGDDEATDDHTLLRLHVSSTSLQDGSDDAPGLTEQDAADYDASQSNSHRSGAQRRRKIGKGIQLILLRKFVQCAKQFNKIPDRETTEQLLEQGYDEFYYQGGNLNEPRLSYTAFLKLCEKLSEWWVSLSRALTKKYQKEQMEIRALIDELEHVRHGQQRETLEYDALGSSSGSEHSRAVMAGGSVPILSDSSSIMGDAGTDGGVSTGDLSATETYSSVLSGTDSGSDDVVVSRSKLDLMLRVAQETLVAQKKILEEFGGIEFRNDGRPHREDRALFRGAGGSNPRDFTQVAYAPTRSPLSLSKPPPPVHRIPTHLAAHEFDRRSPVTKPVLKPYRSNSIVRRRLSVKTAAEPTSTTQSQSWQEVSMRFSTQFSLKTLERYPLQGLPFRWPSRPILTKDGTWNHPHSDGGPSFSPSSPVSSRAPNTRDEDLTSQTSADASERQRKPRPPHQKHRKRSRKKKRSSNQEEERPDPQAVAKANAEKVAAALILAQERAKRIQQEKLQLEREQELERQEAACRLQEQMVKIEASYIDKHKQRERVRLKLEKVLQKNSVQSSKVARLSAMKASLETELAAVLEDTAHTRQKRRELELADEKERLKRQREAERALQIRLREEEWSNMMEEEKARSQVAAEARAKASKRVEAHSAKLRKMMHAYRYEPRHSSSSVPSSARSNNDSGSSDEESSESSSRASSENLGKPFKMDFLLRPELADFEEDGLCNNSAPKTTFRWQVPSFSDPVKFKEVLLEMVSDDEE
ncbi:hypothetical protein GQ600_21001 [Phytophthora cactorum]|nr:hypothetical protein GQ600_21001 [Phytophthora cactorum]